MRAALAPAVVMVVALALAGCDGSGERGGGLAVRTPALTIAGVNDLLAFAEGQMLKTEARLGPSAHPLFTATDFQGGAWETGVTMDWRSPFFAASEWLLFRALGDTANGWRARADERTRDFDAEVRLARTHDVGFKTLLTYGLGFAVTKNEAYRAKIFEGANALGSRFLPQYGVTQSWDDLGATPVRVIVDNMMNVELFFLAAELTTSATDRDRWLNMGVSHAVTTERNHIRDSANPAIDGSTCHVYFYDRGVCVTHQGLTDSSTWSRGQAWAMYGYTTSHRYVKAYPQYATQARLFLDTARRTSDLYLRRLAEPKHGDAVPLHDFDAAAGAPKDTTAAAVAASALIELSTVAEVAAADRARYKLAAERMLDDLGAPAGRYREPPGALGTARESILLRGTTSFSDVGAGKVHIERGIIYGDYYFLEALTRYKAAYDVPTAPDAGAIDARPADTGSAESPAREVGSATDVVVVDAAVAPPPDAAGEVGTPATEDARADQAIAPPADAGVVQETRPPDGARPSPGAPASGCGCALDGSRHPSAAALFLALAAIAIHLRRSSQLRAGRGR